MEATLYHFDFNGRVLGDIGITEHFCRDVWATSYDEAAGKLYDTHEHIHINGWTAWREGPWRMIDGSEHRKAEPATQRQGGA